MSFFVTGFAECQHQMIGIVPRVFESLCLRIKMILPVMHLQVGTGATYYASIQVPCNYLQAFCFPSRIEHEMFIGAVYHVRSDTRNILATNRVTFFSSYVPTVLRCSGKLIPIIHELTYLMMKPMA